MVFYVLFCSSIMYRKCGWCCFIIIIIIIIIIITIYTTFRSCIFFFFSCVYVNSFVCMYVSNIVCLPVWFFFFFFFFFFSLYLSLSPFTLPVQLTAYLLPPTRPLTPKQTNKKIKLNTELRIA